VLQVRTEEHVQRVGRRADHRLATAVQRGVQRHTVAGQVFQRLHHVVVARIVFTLEHLGTRGAVLVDHFRHTGLPLFSHFEGEGHERRRVVDLDHLRGDGVEHRRAERSPAFAELDLLVDAVGHARHARATDDRTTTQGTRAELHAALEPGHRVAVDHDLRDALGHVVDLAPLRRARVTGAGGDHVLVGVRGAEVDVFHLLDRHAAGMGNISRGADCGTGVAGGGLHEQFGHVRTGDDLLVQLDVQRAAAGEGQLAGFLEDVAQVVVDHLQGQFLEQRLHAGGVVDVRLVGDVAFALRTQPLDQLRREVEALALLFIAAQADDVGVLGVDHQFAVFEAGQAREVVLAGVAVGRHPHDLELAIEHLEAEELGDRAVQAAQGVRIEELLDLVDLAVLAIAEEGRGVFALAVDAEDRGLFLETGAVIGAGCVGQVVLDRFDLDFLRIEAQLLQTPDDLLAVALVAAVAHQDRVKGAVRGVPVALGIVPASLAEQADRGERNRHHIDVGRLDAGLFQAELRRLVGHAVLCMFIAHEALFFGGGDQLAVDVQGRGRIMAKGAGQAKNRQCQGSSLFIR
ncbi:hypothetical protein COLO4_04070, partial [Corchorus olitorius]